jgi:predicted dehydrogenase
MDIFRFGIAGPGGISRRFVRGLEELPDAVLAAVASNSPGKAQSFIDEHSDRYPDAVAYDSYESMAKSDSIDAVYISNLNTQHMDTAILFLSHGKPVICEKPFALNSEQTDRMIECAREHDTFLMEAMWTRFLPVTVQVRKWISEGRIGTPVRAMTDFGMELMTEPERRTLAIEKGGGALLDLGIYPISYFSMLFGPNPEEIISTVTKSVTGVDASFEVIFRYAKEKRPFGEDRATAIAAVSIDRKMSKEMKIIGTEGYIAVDEFFLARSARLYEATRDGDYAHDPLEVFAPEYISTGFQYEAKEVMDCVRSNRKESSIMPLSETRAIMKILDTLRAQWNLVFPQEKINA